MPNLQIVVKKLPKKDGDEQRFAVLEIDPQSTVPLKRADKGEQNEGYTEVDLRRELGDRREPDPVSIQPKERDDYDDQIRCAGSVMPYDRHGDGSGA